MSAAHTRFGVSGRKSRATRSERLDPLHADRAALAAALERALHARGAHQPRDTLLTDRDTLARQHRVHARAAVRTHQY